MAQPQYLQAPDDDVYNDQAKGPAAFKSGKKKSSSGGSAWNGAKDKLVDGGLNYAAQRLNENQKDKDPKDDKYGIARDVARKAVQGAQEHRGQGGNIGAADAARIAKQAAIETGKERLKQAGIKKMAEQVQKHPELAGEIGKLAEGLTAKKLDLSGRGIDKQIDKSAQVLAKKGLESAAKTGGSQLANQAVPLVGSISAADAARGIGRGYKEFKEGHAVKAAEKVVAGVVKSTLITSFRLSYSWEIIGATVGLSLIWTFIGGNILLFLPSRGMSFAEKLGVVALDFVVFGILTAGIISILVFQCSIGPVSWAIWLASWFSSTANMFNDFCKYFSVIPR